MVSPRKVSIVDYESTNSQSDINIERSEHVINIVGWFVANDQESSRQLKKELVLVSNDNLNYSYPVQQIDRSDIAQALKNDKYVHCGFMVQISDRFLRNGQYKLYLKYVYDNKRYISSLNDKDIQIQ